MATRIYKASADFDLSQAHFTVASVDSRYYLRIGALNSEDRRLIGSLIDDGFVGFFLDDARIAIAGIISTYDATNDRIEIDTELPELKVDDAYIIRFTQARPGEDGEGGEGGDGWSPILATVEHGARRVHRVVDWTGGEGEKPQTGQYIGATGLVDDIADAVDIRGPAGEDGQDGSDGVCETLVLVDDPTGGQNITLVPLGDNFRDYKYLEYEVAIGNQSRVNIIPIVTLRDDRDYPAAGVTFRFDVLRSSDNVRNSIQITKPLRNANFRYVALSRCIPATEIPDHTHDDVPDHTHETQHTHPLTVSTRGELIATSSFLPRDLPGSLTNFAQLSTLRWTANPNSQHVEALRNIAAANPDKITIDIDGPNPHLLHIPFKTVADNVDGLWIVCEDLDDEDTEIWTTKVGWNPRGIDVSPSGNYLTEEIPLHFGIRAGEADSAGDEVILSYSKSRSDNYKPFFNVFATGDTLPSTRCRIKVYLAGVFITTEEPNAM